MTAVVSLARLLHREQWLGHRFRRGLVVSVAGSLLLMVALNAIQGAMSGRAERSTRQAVTTREDLDAVRGLLGAARLEVRAVDDPAGALEEGDADLAVAVDGDQPTVAYDPTRESSLEAYGRAHAALTPGDQPAHVALDDLPAARRYGQAQVLAMLVALLASVSIVGASASLAAGRAGSPAEAILATPMRRPAIAAAVAMGAAPTAAIRIGAAVAVGIGVVVGASGASGLDGASVVSVCLAAVLSLVATGCAAGAVGAGLARSHDHAAAISGAIAALASLLTVVVMMRPGLTSEGAAAWVPVLGPQLAIRDAMYGPVPASTALALVASALGVVAVGVALGGRFLAADGRGRRS